MSALYSSAWCTCSSTFGIHNTAKETERDYIVYIIEAGDLSMHACMSVRRYVGTCSFRTFATLLPPVGIELAAVVQLFG